MIAIGQIRSVQLTDAVFISMPWILAFINSHIFLGLCYKPCCVCYRLIHVSFSETYFMPPSFWCSHASKKKKKNTYSMLQIYPTIQTIPDLRPTIFGFAVFHNLLVCIHLFFLGCIVSYLGLVERCVWKISAIDLYTKSTRPHDSQAPFGIVCRACRAFGSVVNQGANICVLSIHCFFHTL